MSSLPPPVLVNDLVEEVLLRLPPEKPAWLVRASAVCKPWRHILAAPRFRRRYREFHGTPPVLGLFEKYGRFIPTSSLLLPAQTDPAGWKTLDCRHGRALFDTTSVRYGQPLDLIVLDPATGHQRPVPCPVDDRLKFSAAVLCATQGCDHHDCQGSGHFLVALVTTHEFDGITSGWLYSSESHVWSDLTPVNHPDAECAYRSAERSVLVGDALYFNTDGIIECQVGKLRLSIFEKPIINGTGTLMTAEGGGLGFAAVEDVSNLTLWSSEMGPEGSMAWAKTRVIDLKALLSDPLRIPDKIISLLTWRICGFAEGTQAIFLTSCFGSCMVDLKSRRARTLPCYEEKLFPYIRFYFPEMEAACTGQGQ